MFPRMLACMAWVTLRFWSTVRISKIFQEHAILEANCNRRVSTREYDGGFFSLLNARANMELKCIRISTELEGAFVDFVN